MNVTNEKQNTEIKSDPVNHPSHYTSGSIEVIDYIEDQKFPYHLGNAVKYISRAGKKDKDKTIEDLEKEFGSDVAIIVDGVTKLEKLKYNEDKLEFQVYHLMIMTMD